MEKPGKYASREEVEKFNIYAAECKMSASLSVLSDRELAHKYLDAKQRGMNKAFLEKEIIARMIDAFISKNTAPEAKDWKVGDPITTRRL